MHRRTLAIFLAFAALCLAFPGKAQEHTRQWVRWEYARIQIPEEASSLYADTPSVRGTYAAGALAENVQTSALMYVNFLRALAYLNFSELPPALITFAFEAHLMALEGLSPRVDSCVKCGQPLEGEARFSAAMGGAACVWCAPASPAISYGARRILYRLPATKFDAFEKLAGHPDWPEAARFFRAYLKTRLSLPEKQYPPLP